MYLQWDPPANASVVAYVLEWGTSPGSHPSSITTPNAAHVVTGLVAGARYYFVVRSVDAAGQRSAPSNEIDVLVPAPVTSAAAPPAPTPAPSPGTPVLTNPAPATSSPQPGGANASAPPEQGSPAAPLTIAVDNVSALQRAVKTLRSHAIVSIAPGTYQLTEPLLVAGTAQDVVITSSSGRAADVLLVGPAGSSADAQVPTIAVSGVTRVTIADLSIAASAGYALVFGDAVQYPTVRGVRVLGGGRFVQSLRHADGGGAAAGLIDGCTFEYAGMAGTDAAGIDIRRGTRWVVRRSLFVNPDRSRHATFGPVVHAWQGSSRTVVERNTFVHTTQEIVLGEVAPSPAPHTAGIVQNNMITRRAGTAGRSAAVTLMDAPSARVLHNSVLLVGTASVAIEYAGPTTRDVVIANNLLDGGIQAVDHATALVDFNLVTATPAMFLDAGSGDLRLAGRPADTAVDSGTFEASSDVDHGGEPRPAGSAPDLGADERQP